MEPQILVGTSGWMYDWNLGGTFEWYVAESGLNAVELNASFYRTPYTNQIFSWARKSGSLRWSVKVHRYITHYTRLSEKARPFWQRFKKLFEPLSEKIDFYLLQLPPSFTYSQQALDRLLTFLSHEDEREKIAVEFRHISWFELPIEDLCRKLSGTIPVSVDSPDFAWFASCQGVIYLRLHGKTTWYWHNYNHRELEEIARTIFSFNPRKIYVFFNNDHWMLENAREMLKILKAHLNSAGLKGF